MSLIIKKLFPPAFTAYQGSFFKSVLLAFFIALSRLIPHPPNMTAVNAAGIFSSHKQGSAWGVGVVVFGMLLGDLVIGFYDIRLMFVIYGSFACVALLGRFIPRNHSLFIPALVSMSGSILFFFMSNSAVWLFSSLYAHSAYGLALALYFGLPFLAPMLIGDIIYTGALFGLVRLSSAFQYRVAAVR